MFFAVSFRRVFRETYHMFSLDSIPGMTLVHRWLKVSLGCRISCASKHLGITSLVAGTTFCPQGRVGRDVRLLLFLLLLLLLLLFLDGWLLTIVGLFKCWAFAKSTTYTTHSWWILSKVDWLMISMCRSVAIDDIHVVYSVFDEDLLDMFFPAITCGRWFPIWICAHSCSNV